MSEQHYRPYDLTELKPVLLTFGVTAVLMGLGGIIAFGVNAVFAWFLVAGGLGFLGVAFLAERMLGVIAGPSPLEMAEQMPDVGPTDPEAVRRPS
jgi:hypothetical protein